LGGVCL